MTTIEDIQRVGVAGTEGFPETIVCAVCGEERSRHLMMFTGHPVGQFSDLDPLDVTRNVWHCCDREECLERGQDPDEWTEDLVLAWEDLERLDERWEG